MQIGDKNVKYCLCLQDAPEGDVFHEPPESGPLYDSNFTSISPMPSPKYYPSPRPQEQMPIEVGFILFACDDDAQSPKHVCVSVCVCDLQILPLEHNSGAEELQYS